MTLQQILLVSISSILLTMAVYHFSLAILISLKRSRNLYFSFSTFGGSMFALFALLLTYPNISEKMLMYQRLRMTGLMVCTAAWIFCVYDIYFKHSIVPKINLLVTMLFAAMVPTPAFLSLPIRSLSVELMGMPFQYHFAMTNPAYSLYALYLLGIFCYSFARVTLYKNPPVSKIYGLIAFLPGIIGGIHDFAVAHAIVNNILISEYLVFGFVMSVIVLFIREKQQNYRTLQKLNLGLEEEIINHTEALHAANEKLKGEIVERKKAEEEISRSQNDLRSILGCISAGYILIDPEIHRIVDANTYALDMIGAARDQVINQVCHQFVCPAEIGKCPITDLGQTVNVSERILITARGASVPILKSVTQVELQNRTYLIESFLDITERKKAEGERILLSTAIEQAEEAVIITDEKGIIQYCNAATWHKRGLTREAVIGNNLFFPENGSNTEELLRSVWETVSSGSTWRGRLKKRIHDGSCIELYSVATPVKDASGGIINYVSVSRDVTREMQLEKQLSQAHKMEAIGVLAGGVAHDLNNILSAMVGYPDLLLLSLPDDSPVKQPLLSIKSAGEKAAAIVNDMLTLARRGVSVSEVVSLNTVITEYLGSQQHEKLRDFHPGVEFDSSLAPDLLNTIGSPVHLSKVVMNLVSNAAEAMPDGGKIIVTTENQYLDKPIKGYDTVNEGDYVVLTIRDSGVGISKEDMSRIFEPFYTKKVMGRSGTGLGLAVVWGTVKDSDGYIVIDSTPGKGTAFILYFPATRQETEVKKKEMPVGHYSGNGEHILVVDDLETQRDIASSMLKRLNYHVATAASGEEAVEHLKSASVDLVILDMIMDPGIDGFETYRRILEIRPGQKAVIASGFSETDQVEKAQRLGAGAYIKKPYTLENLGMAVKAELERCAGR